MRRQIREFAEIFLELHNATTIEPADKTLHQQIALFANEISLSPEIAIAAAAKTNRPKIMEAVLDYFVENLAGLTLMGATELGRNDDAVEIALMLADSGVGISPILIEFLALAPRDASGNLLRVLLDHAKQGRISLNPPSVIPYLSRVEPIPLRMWLGSLTNPELHQCLYLALRYGELHVAEAALACGATTESWSERELEQIWTHIAHWAHRIRSHDAKRGVGATKKLVTLALNTRTAHGKLAAQHAVGSLDQVLGLSLAN